MSQAKPGNNTIFETRRAVLTNGGAIAAARQERRGA